MIVCQCKVVSDADLRLAVEAGARSLGSACRATGAASDCGHCVFQVRAIVGDLVDACTSYTPETLHQLAEVLHEAEEPARRRTA
ncbi:MAG: (2Fe-2S)-binding protein [Dermatophilus congolensis]|nr:(2Fe-2S)-binding protein [Dermatophilus congolensis]